MANVNANVELLRQSELAKLPLFAGDGKDQFTAEQWIERVSRARTASAWTAVQTSTFVYNALRGTALLWYDSLRRTGIDRDDWDQFRAAFLESWSTVRTTRTATVNLADLKQGQNEAVTAFYPRVVKAVDDLEALVPGTAFPLPATVWPDAFTGVDAFMAITTANRTAAANALVAHGATSAFNHMALNLFISNLRPALRDELLKLQPDNLYNAFQQAIQLERLAVDPKRATLPAMPVEATSDPPAPSVPAATDDSSPDDLDKEIDALNFKLRSLKARRDQRQGQPRNGSNNLSRSGRSNGSSGRPPATRDTVCHYCNKKGHYQIDCRSRKRDGAPPVRTSGYAGPSRPPPPAQPYAQPNYTPRPGPIHQVDQSPYYNPFMYAVPAQQDFQHAEG
jgi:hypothetical protein